MFATALLFMLPFSEGVYDFQTDLQEDSLTSTTAVGATSDNLTLSEAIYEDDTTTLSVTSDDSTDVPVLAAYDSTTQSVNITGLTANATRTLEIDYDIDALPGWSGIDTLVSRLNLFWLIGIVGFIPASLIAIWKRWV